MNLFAHETWFETGQHATDWAFAGQALTLGLLAAAVLLTLVVRLIAVRFPGVDVPVLARMAPFMPFAVRLHLAVSLVGLLSMGVFLSPAMDLQPDVAGIVLGVGMGVVAIGMATGYRAREAALLLVVIGALGMLEFGVWDVLQRIDVLGLAFFVLFAGPGVWSADHELGREQPTQLVDAAKAVWCLRVGAGLALIVVAFHEKLANPDMAVAFLADHGELNVAAQLGLGWSDLEFARVAGAIEVLFGLLLISGALPQACVLIAGIPFNATLYFFGVNELLGHLPVYGAMLVLLVYGSDPALRAATKELWPFGRPGALRARRGPSAARA